MKLSEFILLSEDEMKTIVLHYGVLVAKRNNSMSMIFLFQVDGFYVETFCDLKSKMVTEYRAFKNINTLAPYLEAIPIDGLL